MIYLVVGQPRNGKSQFVVSKILEYIAENDKLEEKGLERRKIYCDIAGLKIPEVEPVPDDWRLTPDKSIIIYDEVHFRKAYEYKGNQYSQDPMITELTVHGHFEKDIWLITQDPARLEKGIHKLVEKMYFIKRPASLPKYTNVFEFDKWLSNPEPAANRNAKHKKYLDFYRFHFKDEYQNLYESASGHENIKFKLPRQLFYFAGIVIAILAFVGIGLMNTDTFNVHRFEDSQKQSHDNSNSNNISNLDSSSNSALVAGDSTLHNLAFECRKAENVTKPDCVKWFDDLSKSGGSISGGQDAQIVKYDASKPFDLEQVHYQYTVREMPQFAGCVKFDGKYYGYTQQATRLEISQSDCKKVMEGYRPFNPFREPGQQVQNQQNNQQITEYDSIEQRAKQQVIAEQRNHELFTEQNQNRGVL